jgi:hypothetical protein
MDKLTGTALHYAHHPFMILSCKDAGQDPLDRNSDRPIRHILFLCCQDVRIGCNHPTNIRGRRPCRFADVEHERDNQQWRIRCLAGHGFWVAALTGQARVPGG